MGFLKLPAAILGLKLRFDGIGVGNFPAVFELLRQLQKTIAFLGRASRIFQLELRGKRIEIILGHSDHQPARSDFGLGARQRRSCRNFAIVCQPGDVDGFVHIALADVFVYGIIGDIAHSTVLVALRVEILVVEIHLRKKSVASESTVDTRRAGFR